VQYPSGATAEACGSRRPRQRRGSSLKVGLALVLLTLGPAAGVRSLERLAGPAAEPAEIWDRGVMRQAGVDPDQLHCNPSVRWTPGLREQAAETAAQILQDLSPASLTVEQRKRLQDKAAATIFWRLVRLEIVDGDNHNAGVLPLRGFRWRDASGRSRPLLVFRSAITRIDPGEPSCLGSLLTAGGVRHVVNLYDADRIPIGDLLSREQALSRSCGASYLSPRQASDRYGPWREQLRQGPAGRGPDATAMADLARLIREQILAPGGQPPRGNVYLHCGGGMHRSGIVIGILERCINGTSMEVVSRRYLWHTAWQGADRPGGAEPGNLAVINAFDCASLGALPAADAPAER
jgi:hypothetical protein